MSRLEKYNIFKTCGSGTHKDQTKSQNYIIKAVSVCKVGKQVMGLCPQGYTFSNVLVEIVNAYYCQLEVFSKRLAFCNLLLNAQKVVEKVGKTISSSHKDITWDVHIYSECLQLLQVPFCILDVDALAMDIISVLTY